MRLGGILSGAHAVAKLAPAMLLAFEEGSARLQPGARIRAVPDYLGIILREFDSAGGVPVPYQDRRLAHDTPAPCWATWCSSSPARLRL